MKCIKHKWRYSGTQDAMTERRCAKCGAYQVWLDPPKKWTTCVKWVAPGIARQRRPDVTQELLDKGILDNIPVYEAAVDAINRKVIGVFSDARVTDSGVLATFTPNCEGKRFLRSLGRSWRGLDKWRRKSVRFKARALFNKMVAFGSGPIPFDMLNPPELSGKALRDAINEVRP